VEVLPVGVTHDLEAEDPIVVAAMLYVRCHIAFMHVRATLCFKGPRMILRS
jgi:hypothetical protein